jgi:hypothetical protein
MSATSPASDMTCAITNQGRASGSPGSATRVARISATIVSGLATSSRGLRPRSTANQSVTAAASASASQPAATLVM